MATKQLRPSPESLQPPPRARGFPISHQLVANTITRYAAGAE